MRWSELDANLTLWTLPAARAKNAVQHQVPIVPQVRSILAGLTRIAGQPAKLPPVWFRIFSTTGNCTPSRAIWLAIDLRRSCSRHGGISTSPFSRRWRLSAPRLDAESYQRGLWRRPDPRIMAGLPTAAHLIDAAN